MDTNTEERAMRPTDGAETWCRDCDKPATDIVDTTTGAQYLCHDHALDLNYKIGAPHFAKVQGTAALAATLEAAGSVRAKSPVQKYAGTDCEAPLTIDTPKYRTTYYCGRQPRHDGLHIAGDGRGGTVAW